MARFRPRRSENPSAAAIAARRLAAPTPGALRRERRALLRLREERIRDLGGLMLEMYRQDRFREDLLLDQCAELVSIDTRLGELHGLLASARGAPASRCACGAPLVAGAHFCANCGRPAGELPVVSCTTCGHPLPADANFCAACGTPATALDASEGDDYALPAVPEDTEPEAEPIASEVTGAERRPDSWES